MISAILARSGGPPAAVLITSAASRKYCRPMAAGVITQSACSGATVDLFSVDSPSQHSVDTIDRLFVMVMAMCQRRQALPALGTNSSKAAMLPVEFSPVSKKRTASSPR